MTRNPVLNALLALLYIVLLVSALSYAPQIFTVEKTILIPIAMLSLFVFSAAAMGYIFLYQPLQLFIEGEKKQAADLFLQTLGAFAVSVALLVVVGLYLHLPGTKTKEVFGIPMQGKLNINTVCEGALAYMTFPDAARAEAFVAECKDGKHPEVIERYKKQMNLGDGAMI